VNLSTDDAEGVDFALTSDCSTGSSIGSFGNIFGSLGSSELCLS
jgi:hypothetical protein